MATFRYEARPLVRRHYDPATADCRPCSESELELAFCTSDLGKLYELRSFLIVLIEKFYFFGLHNDVFLTYVYPARKLSKRNRRQEGI